MIFRLTSAAVFAFLAASASAAPPLLFHGHGHGLSFSADGKSLLAPSDRGLAVYEDGAWWEGSGPHGGFSGFSVSERAIYSSGHASKDTQHAAPAGLTRSTDGGRTWQPIALAGAVDFPLLAAGYRSGVLYVLNVRASAAMPDSGLHLTRDEGKSWRRASGRGLDGEIHGLAAHPTQANTLAVATGHGLYLSRDAGETFRRLGAMGTVTALAFDLDGKRLRYARALSHEILEATLDGRRAGALRLPALARDYVTCLAQNPKDERVLAFATRRRDVYITNDGGRTWQQIARHEDSPTN